MCGIVGFVGAGEKGDLERMTHSLAHRGPDDQGVFADLQSRVFLGHRRLSIIDIAGGTQPMWNQEGNTAIVFNGEIYNHMEIRSQLENLGHRFSTSHSDTETLLYAYLEWGEELPKRLNGMFAFVIYDKKRNKLFCARDRFGKKPFYYIYRPGFFAFASELQALTHHPDFTPEINSLTLKKYFAYGFIPAPNAIYKDSFKLPGGWAMTLDLNSFQINKFKYWQFRLKTDQTWLNRSEDDLAQELRHLLSQSIQRRLISDVPLGIFLSGGLDSSTILALLAQNKSPDSIKTFAIGFNEPSYDESNYARQMAEHVGCQHKEEILSIDQAIEWIPEVLGKMGEPISDPSILPTWRLSLFAKKHVTVALGGDGGDELFAGYDPFAALTPAKLYQNTVPGFLHRGLCRLADLLPLSNNNMSLDFKIRRALIGLSHPPECWNPVWMGPLSPADFEDIFQEPVTVEELYSEAIELWNNSQATHPVDKTLEYFSNIYLQDNILTKVDRASMMASLEVRSPFLDNDLVEFAQRLPHRFKFHKGERKYILKKAMEGLLPNNIIYRKKKGFGIPVAQWLRQGCLQAPESSITTSMNKAACDNRWQAHKNSKADHRLFLWSWLAQHHSSP
jgi:asparagine synthase (glutamine-hydrolysing)